MSLMLCLPSRGRENLGFHGVSTGRDTQYVARKPVDHRSQREGKSRRGPKDGRGSADPWWLQYQRQTPRQRIPTDAGETRCLAVFGKASAYALSPPPSTTTTTPPFPPHPLSSTTSHFWKELYLSRATTQGSHQRATSATKTSTTTGTTLTSSRHCPTYLGRNRYSTSCFESSTTHTSLRARPSGIPRGISRPRYNSKPHALERPILGQSG